MVTEVTATGRPFDGKSTNALQARLRGELILPQHAAYNAARAVWDGSFDRYPTAVVRAADAIDIMAAVAHAREHDLPVAVRSGGHGLGGHGTTDGGVVIDLSPMKAMSIDPVRRVAWAQAGLNWGEYAEQAQVYGLATSSGDTATVGVGGLTLGGGIGWMVRKHGLTIDHLLSAEIVTADGRLLRASAEEHPELFWGLRGGGGNFGVATAFEFRLHPAGMVLGGAIVFPFEQARQVLRAFAEFGATAPDELTAMAMVMHAPPLPFIPVEAHGQLMVALIVCYNGDIETGQRVLEPLRSFGHVVADTTGPMPYPVMFAFTQEASVPGKLNAFRSTYLDSLEEPVIDAVVDQMAASTSHLAMAQVRILGGAMARVPADATAFPHRTKPYLLNIIDTWSDPADSGREQAWVQAFWKSVRPHGSGVYVNFLTDEGDARVREAYTPATHQRLVALKNRYDPTNLFRVNQNIKPSI